MNENTNFILKYIAAEVDFQFDKWGEQNWPVHQPFQPASHPVAYTIEAEFYKSINDNRVEEDRLTWDGILLEEVYEALAEVDPERIRAELIQVAAVCVSMIDSIDRGTRGGV